MDAPSSRGQDTRQAILNAAYDLFVAQGIHATSMRQIAESSGTALGGIYNHFESKEQILSAARGMQAELRSQPGFIHNWYRIVVDGGWFTAAPYLGNERQNNMLEVVRKKDRVENLPKNFCRDGGL